MKEQLDSLFGENGLGGEDVDDLAAELDKLELADS